MPEGLAEELAFERELRLQEVAGRQYARVTA
jgi:hypothetical protein